jgi:hypothetical protein
VRAKFEGRVSGQVPFADGSFRCRGGASAGSSSRDLRGVCRHRATRDRGQTASCRVVDDEAADELALEVGDLAVGVLKATSVIIEVPPAI